MPYIKNPFAIEKYLVNPDDTDDEKINRHLYNIALAIQPFLADPTFNSLIINKAKLNANNAISMSDFIKDPRISTKKFKESDILKLKKSIENIDLTHKVNKQDGLYKSMIVENYIPAVFVPNAAIADYTLQPIHSFGVEVNSELPGMEAYEDYIVAWYYDINGNVVETLLGEETAMNTANPVFIIDNAEEALTQPYENSMLKSASSSNAAPLTPTKWESREYQINYRYENSGKSEFRIAAGHINENGIGALSLKYGSYYCLDKIIADVHKNNIGLLLSHNEQFMDDDVLPFSSNFTIWNTYERDWCNSFKTLGSATRNGKTIHLDGRRRYSSEWYAYDPSQPLIPVDYSFIYNNGSKWHDNSKGRFCIYRIY